MVGSDEDIIKDRVSKTVDTISGTLKNSKTTQEVKKLHSRQCDAQFITVR